MVCRVVMVEMDNRVKNNSFSWFGLSLIECVWVLLKKMIIRFFYFNSRIVSEIVLIIVSCVIFVGVIVSMLLRIIVWIFIDIGLSDIIKRLMLKKEEKISLIIVFFFRCECWLRKSILFVVSLLERNVLSEKGSFNIQVLVMSGIIEWDSVLLMSD